MAGSRDRLAFLATGEFADAGEVRADREDERLPRDPDGLDLALGDPLREGVEGSLKAEHGGRPEGVGFGVVVPVVEGDQGHDTGPAGQTDVLDERLGDDLVRQCRNEVSGGDGGGHASGLPCGGDVVGVVRVLPDDGAAHPDADAHRGQANASLSSNSPMSSMLRPALARAFSVAGTGPMPMTSGSTPTKE